MAKECVECKRIVDAASEGVSSMNKLMARGLSMFTSSAPPVAVASKPDDQAVVKQAKPPTKSLQSDLLARLKSHPPTLIATICGVLFLMMIMCCCGIGIIGPFIDPEGFAENQRQIEADQQSNDVNDNNGVEKSTTNEQDMRLRQIDGTFIIQAKKVLGSDHEHLARMITDKRKSFSLYEWENIEDVYATDFRRNSTFNELYQSWKIARLGREQVIGRRRY